jgi:flagellar motor switch protein FliN
VTQATAPRAPEFTPHSIPAGSGADKTAANIELFAGAFFEAAGPALTTALNRAISVRVVEVTQVTMQDVVSELSPPWVFIEVTYQRGATGTHFLVLSRQAALALAAEDETETVEIEPRHQEAIRDTVNQLLLAAGPPLLPLFARSVAFAPAKVQLSAGDVLPGELVPEQRVWLVHAEATGDNLRIEMALTIDDALAAEIAALGAADTAPAAAASEPSLKLPGSADAGPAKIDLILDVTLPVAVELGRARMQIQDILKLAPGSVIALDKSAGDPVELLINDRPFAKGEVVIIDENFGVRLTSIVTATERIRTLR